MHLYEPHFPYEPTGPLASRFSREPYLGEVATADAALASLLEPILAADRERHTLVVLTSDHGESLGEHAEATHGIFAYEAALKVPLVLYQPRLWKPRVVAEPVRHVDVLPTILDTLSLPVPNDLAGQSLLPVTAGRADRSASTYFEALSGSLNRGWAPLYGVIRDRTKFIDLPIPELYDLASDPRETHNLAGSQPKRVEELRSLLASLRSHDRGPHRGQETFETRERLRSLGYLAASVGRSKAVDTEKDDPKRLISLDAMLQEVVSLYAAGDLQGALGRCRELIRRRPDMAVSLLSLAHLERENGNLQAGVDALQKAVAINSNDDDALSMLGAYLTEAGRPDEAVALLEPFAKRPEPDVQVLVAYGLALAKAGRSQAALAALSKAQAVDPSNAMLLVDIGTVRLMAGERKAARRSFEAAVAKNGNVARAHSSLAFMEAEEGRVHEALEHWKHAVALDLREHAKILALAALLTRSGRPDEARPYLEFFVRSAPPRLYGRDIERVRASLSRSE